MQDAIRQETSTVPISRLFTDANQKAASPGTRPNQKWNAKMSKKVTFFYLEKEIEAPDENLKGAAIKALIKAVVPPFDLAHELVLEGKGKDPDKPVGDDETINVSHSHGGPKHFFSRPPTNFGAQ
jgi:hypothetical protein